MVAVFPEFAVNISQKRWACVLDPTLALSLYGLPLVNRLGRVMEVWVARELWHILDNTNFYLQRPDSLLAVGGEDLSAISARSHVVIHALREWERIRLENDPARQNCYWIGDGPMESFLPEGQDSEIVSRYEAIAASLDRRLSDTGALPSAYRDTAALAVSLPAAFILTHISDQPSASQAPGMCEVLADWGVPCRSIAVADPWRETESDLLRQMLVQAGLGKWVWSGLRPAVLHLAAPEALMARGFSNDALGFMENELADFESAEEAPVDCWRDARGFWYAL
ncbi:MAG: hypothetical protein ACFCVA_11535 [Gammaproteobacteria bacterium]